VFNGTLVVGVFCSCRGILLMRFTTRLGREEEEDAEAETENMEIKFMIFT
jgi:hypothetical protein